MYRYLKKHYWWHNMKREIAQFVSQCLTCQQVKASRQRPAGLLQPLSIPVWKWDDVAMDFIIVLPRTIKGYIVIWVVVDRLTKSAHFIPGKATYSVERWAELYLQEIVRLHGIPISSSLGQVGERVLLGPELVQKTNGAIQRIRARMQTAQSRQKSYADNRRNELEFNVGDHVFLRVAPAKGILLFDKKGKLSPRYIGPFEILEHVGPVAYKLALPPSLAAVHNVFHVSILRKYVYDPLHVLDPEPLPLDGTLYYEEVPVEILAKETKMLRNRAIDLVKVLWRNHQVEEATWEREDEIRTK
ncbi:uncharacterized protein LOC111024747 [Momordica charantia]|uniref:Uncharacterized protein LOC111024747 n=1 Tax=Momordica charantia TaxID=3673 RepID=A0A6J1E0B0_MOMCH|nr:uncharacterized protein LOC111024747 [Momordica charantia]